VTTAPGSFSVGDLHARAAGQEVIDDFLGENVRVGDIVGAFEPFVSEPEDVEAGFVVTEPLFVLVKPNPHSPPFSNDDLATFLLLL
jgi:hypothetical protein